MSTSETHTATTTNDVATTDELVEAEPHEPHEHEHEHDGLLEDIMKDTKAKILYVLKIYPYISRPMLQYGLSPSLPPKLWAPCLGELMMEGKVLLKRINTTNPKGTSQTKDVYHLPEYPYPPITIQQARDLNYSV